MFLALFAVDVDIPFVPIAKFILKSFRTGTHAVLVDRYPFSTITIRVESELVAPGCISYPPLAAEIDQPGRFPGTGGNVTNDLLSLLVVIRTRSSVADEILMSFTLHQLFGTSFRVHMIHFLVDFQSSRGSNDRCWRIFVKFQ